MTGGPRAEMFVRLEDDSSHLLSICSLNPTVRVLLANGGGGIAGPVILVLALQYLVGS